MKSFATMTAAVVLVVGCQSEPSTVSKASTTVGTTSMVFNASGAPTASLRVPNMVCEFSCVEKVKQVLAEQAGVKEVKVDFETKVATVAIDETEFNPKNAIAALVDYQFIDSELISSEAKAATVNVSLEK